MIGATKIHTTPYHPEGDGLVERWHRTLTAALMCHSTIPWLDILPTVLPGLCTSVKDELGTSPSELLLGTALRVHGEFFVNERMPAKPTIFLQKFRDLIRRVRPTPTTHYTKS